MVLSDLPRALQKRRARPQRREGSRADLIVRTSKCILQLQSTASLHVTRRQRIAVLAANWLIFPGANIPDGNVFSSSLERQKSRWKMKMDSSESGRISYFYPWHGTDTLYYSFASPARPIPHPELGATVVLWKKKHCAMKKTHCSFVNTEVNVLFTSCSLRSWHGWHVGTNVSLSFWVSRSHLDPRQADPSYAILLAVS